MELDTELKKTQQQVGSRTPRRKALLQNLSDCLGWFPPELLETLIRLQELVERHLYHRTSDLKVFLLIIYILSCIGATRYSIIVPSTGDVYEAYAASFGHDRNRKSIYMRLRCKLPRPSWVSRPPSTWKEVVGARKSTGHGLPSLAIDALPLYGQTQSNVTEAAVDQILYDSYMCCLFARRSWVHTSLTRYAKISATTSKLTLTTTRQPRSTSHSNFVKSCNEKKSTKRFSCNTGRRSPSWRCSLCTHPHSPTSPNLRSTTQPPNANQHHEVLMNFCAFLVVTTFIAWVMLCAVSKK